jgi:hypothetical protein
MTSTRHILIAAILITMAIGFALILVGASASHATELARHVVDYVRSSWGNRDNVVKHAVILRAHIWG